MRLDDLDKSSNIEDRRGDSGGGGGFGLPIGGGGLGIGTVVVLGLIGWALGIDPRLLIGGAENLSGADSRHVQRSDRCSRLRRCSERDGSVLLSGRPEGVPRHRVLPRARES